MFNGNKLYRENYKLWFIFWGYWVLTNNIKWVINDSNSSKIRRNQVEEDELEFVNVAILGKLALYLSEDD